jgi:predicted small secreted protein
MKTLMISLLFCLAFSLQGCATARGILDAGRSLGGGILDDATGVVEGISGVEQKRQSDSD